MEESVALDSSKQKQFVKSVRGIKKLLKKKNKNLETSDAVKETGRIKESEPPKKLKSKKIKSENKIKKANPVGKKINKFKKRGKRGLVYLSHIPHGFYEQQMTEYFKQFGVVTNARVIRSSRTGNSKGYAFVEFKEPSVAEIVAETMNNYLMGKRLIKAVYIPPEKQKLYAQRKNWNNQTNPAKEHTLKMKKVLNADKSDQEELLLAKKLLSSLASTKKKLKTLDIDYDFFTPVDIPENIEEKVEKIQIEVKDESSKKVIDTKKKIKAEEKKTKAQQIKIKNEPTETKKNVTLKKENKKNQEQQLNKNKKDTKPNKNQPTDQHEINKRKTLNKQQKKQETELKATENFININNSDDDESDGSVTFDSDEFEKMIENEDDDLSSADESDDSNEEIIQTKDNINKKITLKGSRKENGTFKPKLKNGQGKENSKALAGKRKKTIISDAPVNPPKKPKFEKQNKKALNKLLRKKNKD